MFVSVSGALGLGAGRVAKALAAALGQRAGEGVTGPVLAIGDDLGRALERAGLSVQVVAPAPKRRRKGPPIVAATLAELPAGALPERSLAALFAVAPAEGELVDLLRASAPLVRDGGLLALCTPGSGLLHRAPLPETLTAAFLHAGLVDLEQRPAGGALITLGQLRHASR